MTFIQRRKPKDWSMITGIVTIIIGACNVIVAICTIAIVLYSVVPSSDIEKARDDTLRTLVLSQELELSVETKTKEHNAFITAINKEKKQKESELFQLREKLRLTQNAHNANLQTLSQIQDSLLQTINSAYTVALKKRSNNIFNRNKLNKITNQIELVPQGSKLLKIPSVSPLSYAAYLLAASKHYQPEFQRKLKNTYNANYSPFCNIAPALINLENSYRLMAYGGIRVEAAKCFKSPWPTTTAEYLDSTKFEENYRKARKRITLFEPTSSVKEDIKELRRFISFFNDHAFAPGYREAFIFYFSVLPELIAQQSPSSAIDYDLLLELALQDQPDIIKRAALKRIKKIPNETLKVQPILIFEPTWSVDDIEKQVRAQHAVRESYNSLCSPFTLDECLPVGSIASHMANVSNALPN